MTTAIDNPATEAAQREEIRRASYIDGLRAFADILEDRPEVPLPYDGNDSEMAINHFLCAADPRAELAAAARAFPCSWRKEARDEYFDLHGELHGLKLRLTAFRDAVCERVVTGTREVTEEVSDPEALAAVPKVAVTKVIEDVSWICAPLMAPAETRVA
jgi:hypothetical protein